MNITPEEIKTYTDSIASAIDTAIPAIVIILTSVFAIKTAKKIFSIFGIYI